MKEIRHNGHSHLPVTMLALLVGAAAGATAALLTAPRTGRQTREAIKSFARRTGEKATRIPAAVGVAYGRGSNAAKRAFSEALDT